MINEMSKALTKDHIFVHKVDLQKTIGTTTKVQQKSLDTFYYNKIKSDSSSQKG